MLLRRILPPAAAVLVGLGLLATGSVADAGTGADGRQPESGARQALAPAIISIGDSYISGEAGRWLGNSPDSTGNRAGTDRAFVQTPTGPTYDATRVYGTSGACHRSDVAPITQVRLRTLATINIACSGAVTGNVLRGSAGGVGQNGEATQDDQLSVYARLFNVKAIALTIGGNDLGFSDIVIACVLADLDPTHRPPCNQEIGPQLPPRLAQVQAGVVNVINDIRAVMADAGYRPNSFKLVVTSYPIGLPTPEGMRYPQAGTDRLLLGGCPFLDADVQWGHSDITPRLSQTLRAAATQTHSQFLDVTDALRGHELCSAAAVQPTGSPDEGTAEWLRWIDLAGQGSLTESFHPNAFGQKALGRCLAIALLLPRDLSCHAVPGKSTAFVHVRPLY